MILEYHRIAEPDGRWTRSPAHLREDLDRLWDAGYRSIALDALIPGTIDLPPGTSPVVLTFDDSSPGQFRYLERDGRLEIDPDCAVGILEAFTRLHPGFGLNATFFVLPAAAEPNRLFGQPDHELRKLQYLVSRGFELGNHTLWQGPSNASSRSFRATGSARSPCQWVTTRPSSIGPSEGAPLASATSTTPF
jgi:hypothetical protein